MQKNAKIAVTVAVLAFLVLLIVVSGTVFCVSKAQLVWYNKPASLSSLTAENVLASSQMEHANVFLLDRNGAARNIENKYTNLRVIKIEVTWPNGVKIHVAEREKVFAIKVANNQIAYTDEYFKVLKVDNSAFICAQNNEILLDIPSAKEQTYKVGDTVTCDDATVFKDAYIACKSLGKSLSDIRAIFAEATINRKNGIKLEITTHFGVTLKIDNPFVNTDPKTRMALRTFEMLTTEDYGHGTIEVFVNSSNELEARYIA